jgi:hypothetical protein
LSTISYKSTTDFCQLGLSAESGDCDPGYYCPEGQTVATPANYSCPLGYFCVGGKELAEACPSGTYQVCHATQYLSTITKKKRRKLCIVVEVRYIWTMIIFSKYKFNIKIK